MATYKIIGERFLRKYTAGDRTPVYAAATDAQKVVDSMCDIPWQKSDVADAVMPQHGEDSNIANRERFDAALFCGEHSNNQHRAFANAAVYRYVLPDSAVGTSLTGFSARITSDPYNSAGARIHIATNSTGIIPTNCHDCRGENSSGEVIEDGTTAVGVAPRITRTISGGDFWYPNTETVTMNPVGGLTLQKYVFVFVLLESYSTTRGNWLEGSSHMENLATIETSSTMSGWDTGSTHSLHQNSDSTVLQLINLRTRAIDAELVLSGPVHDIQHMNGIGSSQFAFITGDFDDASLPGMPGMVLWSYQTRQIVTLTEDPDHPVPAGIRALWRDESVRKLVTYDNQIKFIFPFVPDNSGKDVIHVYIDTSASTVASATPTAINLSPTAMPCSFYCPHILSKSSIKLAGNVMEVYTEGSLPTSVNEAANESWKRLRKPLDLRVSGDIVDICEGFGDSLIIGGQCTIDGVSSFYKVITALGFVEGLPYNGGGITPDTDSDIKMRHLWYFPLDHEEYLDYRYHLSDSILSSTRDRSQYWDFHTPPHQSPNPAEYEYPESVGGGEPALMIYLKYFIRTFAICGSFSSINGIPANGLAISAESNYSRLRETPTGRPTNFILGFDVGPTRSATIFAASYDGDVHDGTLCAHALVDRIR